jgi:hypothetical protein
MKKQAKVVDDWMKNACCLTSIYPGSIKSGSLDTTKIFQPEGTRQKPDVHPVAQNLSDITDTANWSSATCVTTVKCMAVVATVSIIKSAGPGQRTT